MKHSFDIGVAESYGVHSAVIFQYIHFWCQKNEEAGINKKDGRYWVYTSVKALADIFPYLSEKQIRLAIRKLVDGGAIVTGCYNETPFDRRTWYALTETGKNLIQDDEPDGMVGNPPMEGEGAEEEEPQNTQEDKPEGKKQPKPRTNHKQKPQKQKYGEYQHVELSDEDLESLNSKLGNEMTNKCITFLDEYIEMNKKYKRDNHKLCIFRWVVNAVNEKEERERRKNPGGGGIGGYDWDSI